ncbi:hypothetical protein [Bradyrhizobium sp. 170]|uniref:hypothetical protein n=1 Tax=Bradyrhizobium sp. 170 TaxID=2782641 RepID=UPI001FFE8C40|nr:hypothetical protein [Bradyrhizobium sp. 170]
MGTGRSKHRSDWTRAGQTEVSVTQSGWLFPSFEPFKLLNADDGLMAVTSGRIDPLALAQTSKGTLAVMQPVTDSESAGAEMHRSIMTAFCDVLRTTQLSPMTVMSLAASALGTVYREVADQHRCEGGCPCGWKPDLRADVEALQAALAATTQVIPSADLRAMQAAGRA